MQPTIEAALIAGGVGLVGVVGTVIVAIIGAINIRRASNDSIRAERQLRLWEKRAASYEDALVRALKRQVVREEVLISQPGQLNVALLKESSDYARSQHNLEVQGRLNAYASEKVRWALIKAQNAESSCQTLYNRFISSEESDEIYKREHGEIPIYHVRDIIAPPSTLNHVLENAKKADDELVAAIRAELSLAVE